MAETYYHGDHDSQFDPRTIASPYDCNMAAAKDLAIQWSLGLIDRTHDDLRHLSGTYWELTDPIKGNEGTNIAEAGRVLDVLGVRHVIRDSTDGDTMTEVNAHLGRGEFIIAHGDYGAVPAGYRGPIDRYFEGLHSVFLGRRLAGNIRVGDGLSSEWTQWPEYVVDRYMGAFPGPGFTYIHMLPRKVRAKDGIVNVRSEPTRQSAIVAVITISSRVVAGGIVLGESIGGNRNWFRVWHPAYGISYIHTSVASYL